MIFVYMMFYLNSFGDLVHDPAKVEFGTQAECVEAAEKVNKHKSLRKRFCLRVLTQKETV